MVHTVRYNALAAHKFAFVTATVVNQELFNQNATSAAFLPARAKMCVLQNKEVVGLQQTIKAFG